MTGAADTPLCRAVGYLERVGDPLDRARQRALLEPGHEADVLAALRALPRPPGRAAVEGIRRIAILADHRLLDLPDAEREAERLAALQRRDGSWEAGSDRGRLIVTAHLAGFLARSPFARVSLLRAASDFVAARWDEDRVRAGDVGLILAFGHCFSSTDHDLSDAALQWCGRELERGFRSGRIGALETARAFTLADVHALPGGRIPAAEVVAALRAQQRDDGGWGSVSATLDALLAWVRLAPVVSPAPEALDAEPRRDP